MSRPKRKLKPTFLILCEGVTEYNYFYEMKNNKDLAITLKPRNMEGGCYKNFLKELKISSNSNYIAKFIIFDLDVLINNPNEEDNFNELLKYCINQNKNRYIPIFLIINNPDFEYICCLHCSNYNNSDYKKYIKQTLNFKDLEKFKNKPDIYQYLNSKDKSISNLLSKLNSKKFIKNNYSFKKKSMDIAIKSTIIEKDNAVQKGSNINEFFELLDILLQNNKSR